MNKKSNSFALSALVKVAVMAAASIILTFFKFPIPIAPPFMEIDLADIPALITGFAIGPAYGVLVVFLKNLLHLLQTTTGGVGELSNFIVGATFVLVSAKVYDNNRTWKNSFFALAMGVLAMSIVATLSNTFVIFPLYGVVAGMDRETFINMVPNNNLVNSYYTLMFFAVFPFNIIKGFIASIITELVYKRVSPFLKK